MRPKLLRYLIQLLGLLAVGAVLAWFARMLSPRVSIQIGLIAGTGAYLYALLFELAAENGRVFPVALALLVVTAAALVAGFVLEPILGYVSIPVSVWTFAFAGLGGDWARS